MQGQDGLAVGAKEHQVHLPVAGGLAVCRLGPFCQRAALGNERGRTAASAPPPAPFRLGARQVLPPVPILRACLLPVNKAIDGLVGDDRRASLPRQVAAAPTPRPRLVVGIPWPIACRLRSIALYLPRDCRWRATQSCSDFPLRGARGKKSGHFTPLFKGKLCIVFSHGNTLAKCCTSFVILGNPATLKSLTSHQARGTSPRATRRGSISIRHSRESGNPS